MTPDLPSVHQLANPDADTYYARADHDELLDLAAGDSEPLHATASAQWPEARRRTSGPAAEPSPSIPAQQPPDTFAVLLEHVQAALDHGDCWWALKVRLFSVKTELTYHREDVAA